MGISKFYNWIDSLSLENKIKSKIRLSELTDKVIAVDTSILLYRFKKQGQLIPKMF